MKIGEETLIYLPSVGTYFDPLKAVTYASFEDGEPDFKNPVDLDQVCDEWITSLSRLDFIKVIGI